jgi:hypothetical protein
MFRNFKIIVTKREGVCNEDQEANSNKAIWYVRSYR